MNMTPTRQVALYDQMKIDASGLRQLWAECGRMCLPNRQQMAATLPIQGTPELQAADVALLNSVAVQANEVLASGCVQWITPSDQAWFTWQPVPGPSDNDETETWLANCSEIATEYLRSSNFYTVIHEMFLSRPVYGTAGLSLVTGKRHPLHFETFDNGTFYATQDEEKYVNRIIREVQHTAEQAEKLFGLAAMPEKVRNQLKQGKVTERSEYIDVTFERDPKQVRDGGRPNQRPWGNQVIHLGDKHMCLDSGFNELPTFISRYQRWSQNSVYGVSPAMRTLAEIRGVNYLEMLMATLAEVTVNPRLILPETAQGVPDLRAGGITIGGIDSSTYPKEWMTGGKFDVGIALIERKEKAINDAFHRSMFEVFNQRNGDLNIPHVRAIEAEKLARFSPSFTLLTSETINPMLERVFMLLYRAGLLPSAPKSAMVTTPSGESIIQFPRVVHTSRMALSMQALKKSNFSDLITLFGNLEQVKPGALDNLNTDRAFRDIARTDGLPSDYLHEEGEVVSMREARQMAAQQAEQMEMMKEAARNPKIAEAAMGAMGAAQ